MKNLEYKFMQPRPSKLGVKIFFCGLKQADNCKIMDKYCVILVILAISALMSLCSTEEDLYGILGVRKTASDAEIKKAYKKMAREWYVAHTCFT